MLAKVRKISKFSKVQELFVRMGHLQVERDIRKRTAETIKQSSQFPTHIQSQSAFKIIQTSS